jgi:hypothetical protein
MADLIRRAIAPQCLCSKLSELLLGLTAAFLPIEGISIEHLIDNIVDAAFNTSMMWNGAVDSG